MLWSCFAASGPAALKKVNGIMEKEDYLQIFQKKNKNHHPLLLGAVGSSDRTVVSDTHQKW